MAGLPGLCASYYKEGTGSMEKIGASKPVNKIAALVTSKGYTFEPERQTRPNGLPFWEHKPETNKVPANCPNLTGQRKGRFTVVGYYKSTKRAKGSPSTWVVRCDCGMYEVRSGSALRNPMNDKDRCYDCQKLYQLQRNEEYRRLGFNLDERDR